MTDWREKDIELIHMVACKQSFETHIGLAQ